MEAKKTVLLLLVVSFVAINTQDPTDFDYKQHGKDWPGACSDPSLAHQSPIILPKQTTSEKSSYFFADFRSTAGHATLVDKTILINTNDTTQYWFGEVYTELLKGTHNSFKAVQIKIRSRSQHRIGDENGFKDLQVQIYFLPLIGKLNDKLMIGLLFEAQQEYPDDPFLAQIIKGRGDDTNGLSANDEFDMNVDLSHLLFREDIFNFWFYLGSITVPPCSDKRLNWIIPDKVYKMSAKQNEFFKNLFSPDGNWRDVQPSGGNEIGYAQALPVQAEL